MPSLKNSNQKYYKEIKKNSSRKWKAVVKIKFHNISKALSKYLRHNNHSVNKYYIIIFINLHRHTIMTRNLQHMQWNVGFCLDVCIQILYIYYTNVIVQNTLRICFLEFHTKLVYELQICSCNMNFSSFSRVYSKVNSQKILCLFSFPK